MHDIFLRDYVNNENRNARNYERRHYLARRNAVDILNGLQNGLNGHKVGIRREQHHRPQIVVPHSYEAEHRNRRDYRLTERQYYLEEDF